MFSEQLFEAIQGDITDKKLIDMIWSKLPATDKDEKTREIVLSPKLRKALGKKGYPRNMTLLFDIDKASREGLLKIARALKLKVPAKKPEIGIARGKSSYRVKSPGGKLLKPEEMIIKYSTGSRRWFIDKTPDGKKHTGGVGYKTKKEVIKAAWVEIAAYAAKHSAVLPKNAPPHAVDVYDAHLHTRGGGSASE